MCAAFGENAQKRIRIVVHFAIFSKNMDNGIMLLSKSIREYKMDSADGFICAILFTSRKNVKGDIIMGKHAKRVLSWVLALALLTTCAISGLVLPTVAVGENLLTNGDFEEGASVAWGGSAYVMDGVGKDGSWGLKIETTVNEGESAKYPGAYYKESFNGILKPNTTYIFSYDYKHEGKGFGQLNPYKKGTDWTGWGNSDNLTETEWTTVTVEFTTGAAENMNASKGWEWQMRHMHYANAANYGTGAVYADNFKLIEKPSAATAIALDKATAELKVGKTLTLTATATPAGASLPTIAWTTTDANVATVADGVVTAVAAGTATITATADGLAPVTCVVTVLADDGNLLVNGDFEEGASVAWGGSAYVMDGVGKDGSWGLKIETTVNEGESAKYPGAYYKESFNGILKPNTTYIFSYDYKHEGKGFGQLNPYKKGTDWTGWGNSDNLTETEWTTVTVEFTTGAAENMNASKGWEWQMRHMHYANAANYGTGAVYADNFKLIEKPSAATAIALDKATAELKVGKTLTLTATATPAGASLPTIAWTTTDANVATVADGVVTAVAAGTATITATADGLAPVTCVVTVPADDGNLLVNGDFEEGASVAWGGSAYVMDGVGKDGSKGLKITTEVAEGGDSVWPGPYYKGEFNTLLKPNTKYIFSFDYKSEGKGFSRINVLKKGSDWTGWATMTDLNAADWTTYTVEFTTGAEANMVSNTGWEWSAERVQYSSTPGTGAGYFDNFKLVEKVVVAPTEITLNLDNAKLEIGEEVQLSVSVAPDNAEKPEITWESSDNNVATVVNGKVTAVALGTATITAKAGTLTDTCTVTVIEDDGNLMANGDFELGASVAWGGSAYVVDGAGKDGSKGLKITTEVAEGGASVWPGSYYKGEFNTLLKPNTKYIFSFDYKSEGKGFSRINVLTKGSDWTGWATMTNLNAADWTTYTVEFTTGATANMASNTGWEWAAERVQYSATPGTGAGYFDNFKLVEKVVVPATAIKLDKTTAKLKPTQTTTLVATSEPENAEPPVITWSSSDDNVATVVNGVVTAVAAGTATITATYGALTATCVVTVIPDDGNIIINGDFANGTDAWGRDQGQKDKIQADAGKEGAGLKLTTKVDETTTTHQTPGVYYLDKIIAALEPDTIYTFSFDYKHEGMGFGQVVFNISPGKLENGAELKNIALASGTVDWKTMSYTFSTPSAMPNANTGWEWQMRQVQYYDKGQGEGTSWFDNFKLVEVGKVVHADSIAIAPETLELLPNDKGLLSVTTSPIGASTGVITWSSSDPSVVEVDQKGNVTALKASGEATITVTNDKGKSATAKVVITENANVLSNGDFEQGGTNWANVPNVKPGIGKDGSYGIELTHEGTGGWTSYYYKGSFVGKMEPATTYIFSVDYYAPSTSSEVRAWSYDLGFSLSSGNFKVGKAEWQTVTKIFTTPTDMKLNAGWDFSLVCDNTGNPPVVFDNLSIKKYSSGVEADSIKLSLEKLTLIPGRTGALTAHATPVEADLNDMTWTSSDDNVATVEYGVVTGVGKGTAIITGTTKNGKSATCTVTVSGNEVLVLNGSFDTEDDVWKTTGDAAIVDGEGRVNSKAGMLKKDATITQTFKGLEADTPYQLFIRYRTVSGKAAIELKNGDNVLVKEETGTNSLWTNLTFEFTTGETVAEDTVLTLTGLGNGPIYIDNVVIAVKASLIDFTVNDIVWVGGGHQVTPGTELTFAVTVTNIGVDPVLKDAVIVIDLCKNGDVFQTLEHTCTEPVTTGESIIVMATTPWKAEKGDWVISARANPTLSILELDDSNNTDQVNLRVNETILEAPKEAADMEMTELTFSDEFDSYDSIDMYATGKDGYKWYVTRSWGAGTVQPNSYTVKDGIISLHDQKPVFNITLSTVDAVTGVGWDYHYGYLETRLRIVYPNRHEYAEGMSGGIPAIWSFPTDKWLERPGKNRQWVEMDWLEYWGRDTKRWPQYPDGYYTVTLHDQLQNDAGEQESWKVNSNSYQNGLGDGEWHVMGWLWAYNGVIAYIDGEEVFRITYSADGVPSCKVRTSVGDQFNDIGAFSYMNEQELCLYIAGAYDKPLELDYVRIWQGGNAEVQAPDDGETDEEIGDGDFVVDIPAEEFWHNYCTDDWGDAILSVNEENYLNVLAGGEYWDYLTAERKAEINAKLKENGQPTFEELLAAALAIASGEAPDSPATGVTTVVPALLSTMLLSTAGLWVSRKRKK